MDILDKMKELAVVREEQNITKEVVEQRRKELEELPEWKAHQAEQELLSEQRKQEDKLASEIRELAVQIFDGTNKKPVQGIQIKEFSIVEITDEKKALQWASQNAPSTLKLDQTKFKKAVENLELEFIQKKTEFKGQIDSDLSFLLEG